MFQGLFFMKEGAGYQAPPKEPVREGSSERCGYIMEMFEESIWWTGTQALPTPGLGKSVRVAGAFHDYGEGRRRSLWTENPMLQCGGVRHSDEMYREFEIAGTIAKPSTLHPYTVLGRR